MAQIARLNILVNAAQAVQQTSKLRGNLNRVGTAADRSTRKATTGFKRLGRALFSLKGLIAGVGFAAMAKSILDARLNLDRMTIALGAVFGSAKAAGRELAEIRATGDLLGLTYNSLTKSFIGLSAAAKGTVLEGKQVKDLFLAMSKAATALQLSAADTKGSILALQQIMSKGKLSAEELRQQLGERLPGAFQIASRAMGVTTAELDKMLVKGEILSEDFIPKFTAELEKAFGSAALEGAKSLNAEISRLVNAFTVLKEELSSGEPSVLFQEIVRDLTEGLKKARVEVPAFVKTVLDLADSLLAIFERLKQGVKALSKLWTAFFVDAFGAGLKTAVLLAKSAFGTIGEIILSKIKDWTELLRNFALTINGVGLFQIPTDPLDDLIVKTKKLTDAFKDQKSFSAILKDRIDGIAANERKNLDDLLKIAEDLDIALAKIEARKSARADAFNPERFVQPKNLDLGFGQEVPTFPLVAPTDQKEKNNPFASFREGFDTFVDEMDSLDDIISDTMESAARSIEDNVVEGLSSMIDGTKSVGEAFRDMTAGIIQDLIRISTRMAITGLISNIASAAANAGTAAANSGGNSSGLTGEGVRGGFSPAPSTVTGLASGGSPGFSGTVASSRFRNAPRFATGGIVSGDEVPIVAHRGETVFTPEQMSALGDAIGGSTRQNQTKVEVVNVSDPSEIDQRIAGNPQLILNVLQRNSRALKRIVGK